MVGPYLQNTRIEVSNQTSLHASNALWVKPSDALSVRWDTYTFLVSETHTLCDINTYNGPTANCRKCDYCIPPQPNGPLADPSLDYCDLVNSDHPRISPAFPIDQEKPTVALYEGFAMSGSEPTLVSLLDFRGGCAFMMNASFTPEKNGTYQILSPEVASYNAGFDLLTQRAVLAEKKVFVIQDGVAQKVTYRLRPHTDSNTAYVWYKFDDNIYHTDSSGVRSIKPVWDDNFSKDLRVGRVRILKGNPTSDANTGKLKIECNNPNPADPDCPCCIRPSHITYYPNFPETGESAGEGQTCYVQNTPDGSLDLTACDIDNNPATDPDEYTANPAYSEQDPTFFLTWFVAFDPNNPPNIAQGETLAIEFTIQPIQ